MKISGTKMDICQLKFWPHVTLLPSSPGAFSSSSPRDFLSFSLPLLLPARDHQHRPWPSPSPSLQLVISSAASSSVRKQQQKQKQKRTQQLGRSSWNSTVAPFSASFRRSCGFLVLCEAWISSTLLQFLVVALILFFFFILVLGWF